MSKPKTAITLLTLAIALAGFTPSSDAFVRGKEVSKLPVGFVHYHTGTNMCSGTKIADRVILTAAHCVETLDVGDTLDFASHQEHITNPTESSEYQALEAEQEKLFASTSEAIQNFRAGQISQEELDSIRDANFAELDRAMARQVKILMHEPYERNPVKAIFVHSKYDTYSRETVQYDIALIVVGLNTPEIGVAKFDTSYRPKRGQAYKAIGHDKKTSHFSGEYRYDTFTNFKLDRSNNFYFFNNRLSKGKTTPGDSGGPLYRKNPRTGQYDTVVGALSGSSALFGIADKDQIYVPINASLSSGIGQWLRENFQKAKTVEQDSL